MDPLIHHLARDFCSGPTHFLSSHERIGHICGLKTAEPEIEPDFTSRTMRNETVRWTDENYQTLLEHCSAPSMGTRQRSIHAEGACPTNLSAGNLSGQQSTEHKEEKS